MSYICVLTHFRPYIAYILRQHTSVCFLCIISLLFTIIIPNRRSASLARICIISRLFSLPPFLFNSFLCASSLPVLATFAYQTWCVLTKKPWPFILVTPQHTPLCPPLKISLKRSELLASLTSKPTVQGFGAYGYPSCMNRPWMSQSLIWIYHTSVTTPSVNLTIQ